jgi:hypothetical protein
VTYFGHSLILIFDDAGYIAGSQSIVETQYVDDSLVDLNAHQAYQLDFFGESEAYFTTAYFVDPEIICNGGRSEADFNRDGTGDRLLKSRLGSLPTWSPLFRSLRPMLLPKLTGMNTSASLGWASM